MASCETCANFHPEVTNQPNVTYPGDWAGECRAEPPKLPHDWSAYERQGHWPIVARDSWCGRFRSLAD